MQSIIPPSTNAITSAPSASGVSGRSARIDYNRGNLKLPAWVWVIAAALIVWGSFSANPLLTPAAIIAILAIVFLLWRPGEPPVLLLACAMQWLQATAPIFYTDVYNTSLQQASGSTEFETATWLSLVAVLVFAIGMRAALIRSGQSQGRSLLADGLRVDIRKAFFAYLATFLVAFVIERIAFSVPAITQPLIAIITLKWTVVFIVAYSVIEQRRGYGFLAVVTLVETAIGLLGFFSSFKSVFFFLLIAAMTSPLAMRGRRLGMTLAVAVVLFFFGVVWTAIKAEYRDFVNQGTGEQVELVSTEQKVGKLTDLVSDLTWENFIDGLDAMIVRVGYTKFFALTLLNVPDHVPHENGALWAGALKQIVTPRLFFPEKAAINDSERTALYAGIDLAGAEQGTSITLGYVAESYIDFGPIWRFAPIFLLGLFFGLIYRVLVIHSRSKLICTAIATSILIFNAYAIETSNIKIVGGTVMSLLVVGTLYLVCGRLFRAWLEPHNRHRVVVTPVRSAWSREQGAGS
jgi:hypothetical protein